MDKQKDNPRMTMIFNNTQDQEIIQQIVQQIQQLKNQSVFYVLSKFIDHPSIKFEPDFIESIFNQNLPLIEELLDWMLIPRYLINRKKIKSNVDAYPYQSKQFLKDNWCFYERFYIALKTNKFLEKQFYDHETFQVALGYFLEVMIPFAKYEFSNSYVICQTLGTENQEVLENYNIIKIFPQSVLNKIIQNSHHEAIYKFLTTIILLTIEDPEDSARSEQTLLLLLSSAKKEIHFETENYFQILHHCDLLENISVTLKETITNIDPGNFLSHRIETLVSTILKSEIIEYAIDQIAESHIYKKARKENCAKSIGLSSNLKMSGEKIVQCEGSDPLTHSQPIHTPLQIEFYEFEEQEEHLLEILFKILTYSVQIFIKIPKYIESQGERDGLIEEVNSKYHKVEYQQLISDFHRQMQDLLTELPYINFIVYRPIHSFYTNQTAKTIKFSSGQNIKPITFMKYQYFKLLYSVILMLHMKTIEVSAKSSAFLSNSIEIEKLEEVEGDEEGMKNEEESQKQEEKEKKQANTLNVPKNKKRKRASSINLEPFQFNIEKLYLIEVIEKYLSQNRWNNIVHQTLEKIFHLLVMREYEYLSKNIKKQRSKKMTESFLSYLIENFTQRDYIFLDTFKFTTQGNLHSLYNIAKDLAYTLNSTNQLVVLLNEFQPWKKFIMNDLNKYEEHTFPKMILPEFWDDHEDDNRESLGLKVDEADSIKKLIENISAVKRWPTRPMKPKGEAKRSVLFRNSGGSNQKSNDYMTKSHGDQNRQSQKFNRTLDEILRKKIEYSNDDGERTSEIKQFQIGDITLKEKVSGCSTKMVKSDILSPRNTSSVGGRAKQKPNDYL